MQKQLLEVLYEQVTSIHYFVITLGILLAFSFGRVAAQEPGPRQLPQSPDMPDASSQYIPIQGRLTDSRGDPVSDGPNNITFRLYGQFLVEHHYVKEQDR